MATLIQPVPHLYLYSGNKNYSSWSMRPWVLMAQAGITFDETIIPLDQPTTATAIAAVSSTGKVPVLRITPVDVHAHGDAYQVHDSLAICETLADYYPQHQLLPADAKLRALARSACAEMHTGFVKLRHFASMNITRTLTDAETTLFPYAEVLPEVERLIALWSGLLQHPRRPATSTAGSSAGWLLGEFGMVDAFFAPVITRLNTYRITERIAVPAHVTAYMQFALSASGYQRWFAEAQAEVDAGMTYPSTDCLYRLPADTV